MLRALIGIPDDLCRETAALSLVWLVGGQEGLSGGLVGFVDARERGELVLGRFSREGDVGRCRL